MQHDYKDYQEAWERIASEVELNVNLLIMNLRRENRSVMKVMNLTNCRILSKSLRKLLDMLTERSGQLIAQGYSVDEEDDEDFFEEN